jgi:hypothetical protein
MPINLIHGKLGKPETHHLSEWLRFAGRYAKWQVYVPDALA